MTRAPALLLLIAVASGCVQPVVRRDWSGYTGPGAAVLQREAVPPPDFPDPLEAVNRSVWGLNHAFIVGAADPVGRVYRVVVPRFARDRLRDFAANLEFPRNFVANLLQGQGRAAGSETARFAVNTTVGVAGLWDPATHWLGIPAAPEDFGQTFARWGWHPSTFVVLPIAGPSTVRDGVGLLPDTLLDPATYFFPAGPALLFNQFVDTIPAYRRFVESSPDAYDDSRLLWNVAREVRIDPPDLPAQGDDTGVVQTLRAAFLAPRDPGFFAALHTGTIVMPTTGRLLPFSYRLQAWRAPVVFVVPGFGTHRLANSSLALAEMAWARGFSVVIVSSTMNPEFIARGASVPVPGYAPGDARDVHTALDGIARDLDGRYPGRLGARVYLGYSLGAFHGFYVAAEERAPENHLVRFDRYVLIDPPVRLMDGMQRLDAFHEVPLALPPAERGPATHRILKKAVAVGKKAVAMQTGEAAFCRVEYGDLSDEPVTCPDRLPFTNDEAEYLIGLAFRRSLTATIWASQRREDLGVLRTERRALRRGPNYREIADYCFQGYLYAFVLPYHRDRLHVITSADALVRASDLHAIAAPLGGDPKLRLFANQNDFVTSDDDLAWLTALVGRERATVFPSGGHGGNLDRPEVQSQVMSSVADLR